MPSSRSYLVISLGRGWSSDQGRLNAVSVRAVDEEDAVRQRCLTAMTPPTKPMLFVVVDLTTDESRLLEWVPPEVPESFVRRVRPDA